MTEIPLILKLKKEMHKSIARAQDIIVEEIYKVFDKAVLHGGTAIWRCYNGNRFSEDIDVYLPKEMERINRFFGNIEKRGFIVERKKIGQNSLFSSLLFNRTLIRFEAIFKTVEGNLKEYSAADGNFITVYTLMPEQIIKEKIDTYCKRRKIRDLYDIFFLLRHVKDRAEIKLMLKAFINSFKAPVDEKDLQVLIIEGLVPNAEEMLQFIERY